jgi:hypothetical protein
MTATLIAYAATFPFSVRAYARMNASRAAAPPSEPPPAEPVAKPATDA